MPLLGVNVNFQVLTVVLSAVRLTVNYLVTGNLRSGMSQVLRGKLPADPSEPCVGDVRMCQVRLGGVRA